jgi:polysaccharide biosynthesis transport protein
MKDISRFEFFDFLTIPWRRRWYFLAAMILVMVGVAAYAWMRPNLYRSETRIFVESATLLDDPLSPDTARDRTEERINAIRQLLESRTILERVVEEFRLRSVDASVPMEDQIKFIRSNLEISKATGSIFTMAYSADSPQVAEAITKRLAEILIQTNTAAQKDKAIEKDEFIEQELRQTQLDLAAIDDRIKQFKANHLGELPEQGTANMNALNGLHNQLVTIDTALDRFRDQQKALEFRIQQQRNLSTMAKTLASKEDPAPPEPKDPNAPSSPAVQLAAKRSQLAEALSRYTPKHPDVIRLAKEVEDLELQVKNSAAAGQTAQGGTAQQPAAGTDSAGNKPKSRETTQMELTAESEIESARYELDVLNKTMSRKEKEREDLIRNISVYQNRLNLAPALEQELIALMREHDAKQQQVENLGTRKFNAGIAANAVADKKNDIYRILDDASVPVRPTFPTRLHILLIGFIFSMAIGYGTAIGREILEPSLANEDEVAAVLKMPVLANVPEITKPSKT